MRALMMFLVICALAAVTAASEYESLSVTDILDRCEKTQQSFVSHISKSENFIESYMSATGDEPTFYKDITEVKYDGNRYDIIKSRWHDLESRDAPTPLSEALNARQLFDGESTYDRWRFPAGDMYDIKGNLITISRHGLNYNRNIIFDYGTPLIGIFTGDTEPAVKIVKESDQIRLRPNMEIVGDSRCYVIDAAGEHGKYTVWIDPQHGYNIAKAKVHKTGNNMAYGEPMGLKDPPKINPRTNKPRNELADIRFEMENVRFRQIDGVWVPVEGDFIIKHERQDYKGNKTVTLDNRHNKRTYIEINPDFEAMGAFKADVPNGTKVRLKGVPGVTYVWQNGKFVPDVDGLILNVLDELAQKRDARFNDISAALLAADTPDVAEKAHSSHSQPGGTPVGKLSAVTPKVAQKYSPVYAHPVLFLSLLLCGVITTEIFLRVRAAKRQNRLT